MRADIQGLGQSWGSPAVGEAVIFQNRQVQHNPVYEMQVEHNSEFVVGALKLIMFQSCALCRPAASLHVKGCSEQLEAGVCSSGVLMAEHRAILPSGMCHQPG